MIRVGRSETEPGLGKRLFAAIASVLVAALALTGISIPAVADGAESAKQVITFTPPESDTWTAGQTAEFDLSYAYVNGGATATVTVPSELTVPDEALVVPAGNDAVESIERQSDGTLLVKFKDPVPAGSDQGVLKFEFKINAVQSSEEKRIEWKLNDTVDGKIVTILKEGDFKKTYTDGSSKSSGGFNLGSVVINDGVVSLEGGSSDAVIPYTIKVTSGEARTVTIEDTLGDYLELVGPLVGSKTVADAKGLNSVTSELTGLPNISGKTFKHSFDAEAMSEYTFTYGAKVTDRDQLIAALQAEYNKAKDTPGASFNVNLDNSADINHETKSANNPLGGWIPQEPAPDVNGAFGKTTDLPYPYETDQIDQEGTLAAPIPVKYTLRADLTKWSAFVETKHALTKNVVVTDELPSQISWIPEDAVEVTGAELTKIGGPIDAEAFTGDDYVGKYFFDGKKFVANLGKNTEQSISITLSAQITTLEGLRQSTEGGPITPTSDLAFLDLKNQATFDYGPDPAPTRGVDHAILRKKDTTGGIVDEGKFKKEVDEAKLNISKGQSAKVPFNFTVNSGIGDAAKSKIVDYVDHSVFDVSEETLPEIKESITGMYAWMYPLAASSFDVKLVDGNLELTPLPGKGFPEGPLMDRFEVKLKLPTHPVQGKQTLEITNKASYIGQDDQLQYNDSTEAKVTTYGNEMEIQKKVATASDLEFQNNLRVSYSKDAAGKITLDTDTFVYRIDLIPHGAFKNMVTSVEDVLPSGVDFLGFTNEWGLTQEGVAVIDESKINVGNIEASYDSEANRVTISKGKLDGPTTVYFKVKLVEPKADIGITNVVGSASSTITPTNDYPLAIAKLDSQSPDKKISDENAVFQVKDSSGNVVIDKAFVKDGRLVVSKDGEASVPTVSKPGTYEVVEIDPPNGYKKATETLSVTVAEDGTSPEVIFYNDPESLPAEPEEMGTFSVEKQVKVQGLADKAATKALQDVLFTVTATWDGGSKDFTVKPNGEAVQLDKALTAGTKVTLSESTPVAIEGFTWKEVQFFAGDKALENGIFTVGATSEPLRITAVNVYQEDTPPAPIPDPKTYAIGDFTWIDYDKDGVQDSSEEVLSGVKVTLLDADGNPVAGVDPQVTDEFGRYLFDELPAGEYRVKFELTDEQAETYTFTGSLKGKVGDDSDADPATGVTGLIVLGDDNQNLTKDYDHRPFKATEGVDPTWDAGVVVKDLEGPVPPEEPGAEEPGNEKPGTEEPGTEKPVVEKPVVDKPVQGKELPNTGAAITGAALAALVLAALGAGALHLVRRKS